MEETRVREIFEQDEDTQHGRFLTFMIGRETYGIEIRCVTEIIGIQPITEVPELPDYIKGIINLRGKIIPVMDIRLRFKKPFRDYDDRTCVVVIDISCLSIGIIVDSVSEVILISDADIVPQPDLSKEANTYIKGIGKANKDVKLLLDCEKLLTQNDENKLISGLRENER